MEWPTVTIVLITWNRPREIRETLDSLCRYLVYPRLHLLIADDNSEVVCPGYLHDLVALYGDKFAGVSTSVTDRRGWGANVNQALHRAGPYVYQQEDDYVLHRPLDLREGMALLLRAPSVGMVRYRGISGDHIDATLRELIGVPEVAGMVQAKALPNRLAYWELAAKSESLFVYSNGPHLKDVPKFHGTYGYYPEGISLGECEEWFAHSVKDKGCPLKVAILPDWVPMWYEHIGVTRQRTVDDPCQGKHGAPVSQ